MVRIVKLTEVRGLGCWGDDTYPIQSFSSRESDVGLQEIIAQYLSFCLITWPIGFIPQDNKIENLCFMYKPKMNTTNERVRKIKPKQSRPFPSHELFMR